MGLILLEALLALCIFILIVWWTMFSGRKKGELPQATPSQEAEPAASRSADAPTEAATHTRPSDNRTP
jgi:cbb3-type cytochrome oxidase subunit 3